MASDINKVIMSGRLIKDAEIKYTGTGLAISNFCIASNKSIKDGDGWKDKAGFFNCKLWGKTAEALNKYLLKGKLVFIEGELDFQQWEKDGQKRSKIEINVTKIVLGGDKKNSQSMDEDDEAPF